MKHKFFAGAVALLSLFTVSFTSCDDDDKPTPIADVKFSNVEIGHENARQALIGGEMHIEAAITSAAKIKSIEVKITPKDEAASGTAHYLFTQPKYVGVLNTTFHEHIDIPKTLAAGLYKLTLTVTDANGAQRSYEGDVKLLTTDPNAPIVTLTAPSGDAIAGVAGGTVTFKGSITVKSAVKEVEVEFHGAKEYSVDIDDFKGRTGTFSFEKTVTIPAEATPGTYHVHFTVEDDAHRSATAEVEGFVINGK